MAMLEQMVQDGVALKGLTILERVLDGDEKVTSAQHRAAQTALSAEMKARGTRNRDITNAITVVKMHPDHDRRAAVAEALIRRLVPEVSASGEVSAFDGAAARGAQLPAAPTDTSTSGTAKRG